MKILFTAPRRRGLGLTPLVDVVFILLLFFMLSSSFVKQEQIALASPVTSEANNLGEPQRLGLSEEGGLWLWNEQKLINDKALLNQFDLNKPLLISAKENVLVQQLVAMLIHLDDLGFSQVSIGPLWLE